MRFSKVIVSIVVFTNLVFTAAVLAIFYRVGNEPAVLIGAWFAFTTGELWAMASIRKAKARSKRGENES